MSLYLIGTYGGLPFYCDEELTDEDVQASWLFQIEAAIQNVVDYVPVKVVMRNGAILALPENPEDYPDIWRGAWRP